MPVVTAYLQILILFYQPGGLRLLRLQLVQEVSSRVRGVGEIELARLQLVRQLLVLQTQTAFDPIAVQEEILQEPRRELLLYMLLEIRWKEEWLGARHGPPGQQRDGGCGVVRVRTRISVSLVSCWSCSLWNRCTKSTTLCPRAAMFYRVLSLGFVRSRWRVLRETRRWSECELVFVVDDVAVVVWHSIS